MPFADNEGLFSPFNNMLIPLQANLEFQPAQSLTPYCLFFTLFHILTLKKVQGSIPRCCILRLEKEEETGSIHSDLIRHSQKFQV